MPPLQKSLTDTLRQMTSGFARTQELYTAVKLGIADLLANGPKQAHELAQAVNAHPQALYRFLRVLVARNLLSQEDDGSFRLSALGNLLRSDHPDSIRNLILYNGEVCYRVGQGMLHTVQTGQPAFDHIFGMPFFEYFAQHPDVRAIFNDVMSRAVNDRAVGVVANYDFSQADTIVDVGGGNGTLIAAILRAHPDPRGIVFDAPQVVTEAQHYLAQNGLVDRCQTVAGDFLTDPIPRGGDLYLLSNIIHDWDDDRAVCILRNCRAAMREDSTLLLIEQIMPERVTDAPATVGSDLSMLMLFGSAERTEAEYRSLLTMTGLQLTAVIPFEPTRVHAGKKTSWAIVESKPLNR
jgi:hypothetical protein